MTQYSVSSRAQLDQALATADGDDVILMAGGNYGKLELTGDDNITLKSQSAANPAVFAGVTANQVHNVTMDGIKFDGTGGGMGLKVNRSQDFTIQNSEFTDFLRGLQFIDVTGLNVVGNDVSRMSGDGMTFAQVSNVLIQKNDIYDQNGDPNSSFHKDLIQFWTEATNAPSQNVVIRGNNLVSGDGSTQSLFIYNEAVDRHGAGKAMFYKDFIIEDNTILGGHTHGITVGQTDGLSIRGNTVLQDTRTPGLNQPVNVPLINVDQESTNVQITDNLAHGVPGARAGWVVSGNTIVAKGYQVGDPIGGGGEPNPPDPDGGDEQGTNGNDQLTGGGGPDALRGMGGADRLTGNGGADVLIGGQGGDIFVFRAIGDSTAWARDRIRAGDGGGAFEAGDRISLAAIDANTSQWGNQAFHLQGGGPGQLVISNEGAMTLIRGNVDRDAAFEFHLLIEDGKLGAGSYNGGDFFF